MAEQIASPSPRATVQAELAAMRVTIQQLLARVSDADWRRRSANPSWTVGEVLTHLTWSLEHVPREVECARRGRGMYNLPPILFGPLNMLATRLLARRYTGCLCAHGPDQPAWLGRHHQPGAEGRRGGGAGGRCRLLNGFSRRISVYRSPSSEPGSPCILREDTTTRLKGASS